MMRSTILAVMCTLAVAVSAAGQAGTQTQTTTQSTTRTTGPSAPAVPAAPASATPPTPPPQLAGQPVNVKIEFTITDLRGTSPPIKRTVSVIAADRNSGRVRSSASMTNIGGEVPLNVDAIPTLLSDGKIRLNFSLVYDAPMPRDRANEDPRNTADPILVRTSLQDSVSVVLVDGKPMVVAQSADPIGDRQVTVEVKATILK